MAGVMPPGPSPPPGPSRTCWCPLDPATPMGISTTSLSVALCHSSVTTAKISMGKWHGVPAAPPWTLLARVKKNTGWSHQMLKLSKIVKVCCMEANSLERAWCYVLNTLFPILTNLALHLHCPITHAFHLHHPHMILLHISPLCFRSDTSFTYVSPRQEVVPLHVFKDPCVHL